jgi:integrase
MILLPQTKNGEGKIVHLNKLAEQVIASLPPGNPTDQPFGGMNPAKLTVAFKRVCVRLGIQNFTFHDLRHTAASWLRMTGTDIHTIATILGHKDLRMSAKYSHLSSGFLRNAVDGLDAVFGDSRPQGVPQIEGKSVSVASPTGFEPVLPH